MSFGKKYTLASGEQIPQIGLGTWLSAPGEVGRAVRSGAILVVNVD